MNPINSGNYYIFASNDSDVSGPYYYCNCKLYSMSFKYNDILIRSFIPVVRHSDGAIGLLDLVNLKFYGNDGIGRFIAGPELDKPIVIKDNPYIFNIQEDVEIEAEFIKNGQSLIRFEKNIINKIYFENREINKIYFENNIIFEK